mmetsp:Transcript_1290/g.4404  ORF Transcript_1290/g.4404 Transcript_1290/m.4404 type:complete len:252 (-) Transcript_1290:138-893(-)
MSGHSTPCRTPVTHVCVRPDDVTSTTGGPPPGAAAADSSAWCTSPETSSSPRGRASRSSDSSRRRAAGKWAHDSTAGLLVSTCTEDTTTCAAAGEASSSCRSHSHCASPSTSAVGEVRPMSAAATRHAAEYIAERGRRRWAPEGTSGSSRKERVSRRRSLSWWGGSPRSTLRYTPRPGDRRGESRGSSRKSRKAFWRSWRCGTFLPPSFTPMSWSSHVPVTSPARRRTSSYPGCRFCTASASLSASTPPLG